MITNIEYVGQIGFMVFYSFFSDQIDKALKQDDIFDAILNIKLEYKERKKLLIKMLKGETQNEFTSVEKLKIINYIALDSYFNEIIKNLIREDTSSNTEFSWIKYPFVKIEGNECKVRFFATDINYGREYVGLYNNFVTTPQTERFFLTLSTCIINQRSSVVYGLNESNKKESFKIFSKLVGHYPFFIKCNNLLDTKSFVNIKAAIQKRGNWLVVDEFEKLNLEQISVISEEISAIYRAFHESDTISFHQNTQIFCLYHIDQKFSPNPIIKNSFRLIAVIAPDINIFIQFSLRNIRIANYQSVYGKIVYVLEDLNSKIETLQFRSKRLCLLYFKQFMKVLNLEVLKEDRINDDYELIRNCLEEVFQTKFFDYDFIEVKKFIRSIFILEKEQKEIEKELQERPTKSKTSKKLPKLKEVKLDNISMAVEEVAKINSFSHNIEFKEKLRNVSH